MAITGAFLATSVAPSLGVTVTLLVCCFAALGLGNGALFQLVPLALARHGGGRGQHDR